MSNPSALGSPVDARPGDPEPQPVATLVRDNLPRFRGHAAHYRLSVPLAGYSYGEESAPAFTDVVVSTADALGRVETYIFGADADGNITSWSELPGSIKDSASHAEALAEAGYTALRPLSETPVAENRTDG